MESTQGRSRIHVIVTPRENGEWLQACLAAVFAQGRDDVAITMIEESRGHTRSMLDHAAGRFPAAKCLSVPQGIGTAGAINRAAALNRDAQFVMLLDPEAILALDAFERLRNAFAARPNAAVIGCKVLDGDVETIHHIGLRLRGNGLPTAIGGGELDCGQYRGLQDALTLQVGALLIRSEVWCELGGLDERFEHGFYDRIDFCLRCWKANWSITVAGDATATHFGLANRQEFHPGEGETFFLSRARFLQKHYRPGDWMKRWFPDEVSWWIGRGKNTVHPGGVRWLALRTLLRTFKTPLPPPAPINLRNPA